MIQPRISRTGARPAAGLHATMLGFLTTDAAIDPDLLQATLEAAVAQSFNRITVDGDMSTNDTVLILANGLAGNPVLKVRGTRRMRGKTRASRLAESLGSHDFETFRRALNHVTLELAKMIVRDGEGTSRFVTLTVTARGIRSTHRKQRRAEWRAALVKASWFGGDPNWGRILCALGYSLAKIDQGKVDVGYSAAGTRAVTYALRRGQPAKASLRTLARITAAPEFDIHVFLNLGKHDCVLYAADLTEDYVDFNKGDVSDPASLGG